MGKRDVALDAGLPMPKLHLRPGRDARPVPAPANWTIDGDLHAYMTVAADDDVRVGDLLGFDASHSCLTFDKWRHLLDVDEDYRCLDVVRTFFDDVLIGGGITVEPTRPMVQFISRHLSRGMTFQISAPNRALFTGQH